jgi:hypothetical protein
MKQFLALVVLALSVHTICRAADPASGRWEGSVQIPDRELTLVVDLAAGDNGKWSGSVIIPGFDLKGKQLNDIAVRGSDVSFAITTGRGFQATVKGKVSGDSIAGDFVEGGQTAHFTLKKTGPPQVESLPRSTTVSKELEGEWKGQYQVFGTPRNVTIKLTNHGTDGATADFVVIGRKTTNVPVDLVKQEEKFLTIDSHEMGISYEGLLDPQTGEIKGSFIQGPLEFPLGLHR